MGFLRRFVLTVLAVAHCAPRPAVGSRFFHSEEEAAHMRAPFPEPEVVALLRSSDYGRHPALAENDLMAHHSLIRQFCEAVVQSSGGRCTWREYYSLLNYMRKPFSDVYDPGIDKVGRVASTMDYPQQCEEISRPSAAEFLRYVERNRPFVIRGEGRRWKAFSRWNKRYLLEKLGDVTVSISVSETGDFVGPEPVTSWGNVPGVDAALEPAVLARPASKSVPFAKLISHYDEFSEALRRNRSLVNPSLYMEYMPLSAYEHANLIGDIPPFYWSHILNPRMLLLWLGGGGSRKNGRLHFDKYENLMTVIMGRKTFLLYDPDQSLHVYADLPMRSASLEVVYEPGGAECSANGECATGGAGHWRFHRRPENVYNASSQTHTYSPVDVLNPDYGRYPLLRLAKGFNCTLEEGDMIYVPSHWWHEVITDDDEEGLSAGVNYFFDPFFIRRRDVKHTYLHDSRMYSHLREGPQQSARPCTGKYVCFKGGDDAHKKKKKKRKKEEKRRKKRTPVKEKQ